MDSPTPGPARLTRFARLWTGSSRWSRVRLRQLVVLAASVLSVSTCSDPMEPSSGSISVTPAGQTLSVGEAINLYATGTASDGGSYALGTVTWSSSDESVAVVVESRVSDVLGLGVQVAAVVRGVGAGTATITASSRRAGEASVRVTVIP